MNLENLLLDVDYITSTEIPSYTNNESKNDQVNNIQKKKESKNSFIFDLSQNKLVKIKKVGNCKEREDVICIKIQDKDFSDFPLIASTKNNETKRDEEKDKNESAQKQKLTEKKKISNFSALTKEAIRRKLDENKNKMPPQVNNNQVLNEFQHEIEQYLLPPKNQIINR